MLILGNIILGFCVPFSLGQRVPFLLQMPEVSKTLRNLLSFPQVFHPFSHLSTSTSRNHHRQLFYFHGFALYIHLEWELAHSVISPARCRRLSQLPSCERGHILPHFACSSHFRGEELLNYFNGNSGKHRTKPQSCYLASSN